MTYGQKRIDPFVEPFGWKPYSRKQLKVVTWWMPSSPYHDWDGIIADGSIRAGKTISFIDGFIEWSRNTFSGQDFIISGRSAGSLGRNVVNPLKAILSSKLIPYSHNRSENFLEFASNRYHLFGASNESSQDVIQGLTAAGWLGDEVALYPQSFIEQAIGRCSIGGSKYWLNCNPKSPYHYVKKELIDKAIGKKLLRLHFTMDDNPNLASSTRAKYERMYTGVWYNRMVLGLWVLAEGAIYDMFNEDDHTVDYVSKYQKYAVSIDYGTSNPCTFGLYGWNGSKPPAQLIREYWYDGRKEGRQKTDSEYADDLISWLGNDRKLINKIYVDPSAASFIAELRKRKLPVRTPDNSVIDGIRYVSSLLYANEYTIHESCKNTTENYQAYVWDSKFQGKGEDKPIKENDHACDRDRYFLYSEFGKNRTISGVRVLGRR